MDSSYDPRGGLTISGFFAGVLAGLRILKNCLILLSIILLPTSCTKEEAVHTDISKTIIPSQQEEIPLGTPISMGTVHTPRPMVTSKPECELDYGDMLLVIYKDRQNVEFLGPNSLEEIQALLEETKSMSPPACFRIGHQKLLALIDAAIVFESIAQESTEYADFAENKLAIFDAHNTEAALHSEFMNEMERVFKKYDPNHEPWTRTLVYMTGEGDFVTDNFSLDQACREIRFTWYGPDLSPDVSANFIIHGLIGNEYVIETSFINEYGEIEDRFPLTAGDYYIEINTDAGWSFWLDCDKW